jgi:prepilin-type N-terminal cleavage/methylation domain-containing protein
MTPSRRSEQGFTLLEIIVAITLVAMMAVGLWAVLRISIRTWSRGSEFIDANQRHRSIIDMVRKQIASAYNLFSPPDPVTGGAPYPIFNGAETSFQFISLNSLQFQESPGLTLVTYEVVQGDKGSYALMEKESRYLGQLPDPLSIAPAERTTSVFENLTTCSFAYFDPSNEDEQSKWVKDWDAVKTGRLPSAVSMNMVSRDSQGNTINRRMVVPIQAAGMGSNMIFRNPFSGGLRGIAQ